MRASLILDFLCVLCAAIVLWIERSWLGLALSALLIFWAAYNYEAGLVRSIVKDAADSPPQPALSSPEHASRHTSKVPVDKSAGNSH